MIDIYGLERYMVIGDMNSDPTFGKLDNFLDCQMLHNHVKSGTCFKSALDSCIDLIVSNQKYSLENMGIFDCGFRVG